MTLYESMTRPITDEIYSAVDAVRCALRRGSRGSAWGRLEQYEADGWLPAELADRIADAMIDSDEDGADECDCILSQGRF